MFSSGLAAFIVVVGFVLCVCVCFCVYFYMIKLTVKSCLMFKVCFLLLSECYTLTHTRTLFISRYDDHAKEFPLCEDLSSSFYLLSFLTSLIFFLLHVSVCVCVCVICIITPNLTFVLLSPTSFSVFMCVPFRLRFFRVFFSSFFCCCCRYINCILRS